MSKDVTYRSINFEIRAEKTIVSDTVKLQVQISAMVTGDSTEDALRVEIKETLTNFIKADWQFQGLQRHVDDSGFEKVSLTATARVNERENYNLEGRAKAVSRQGLQLVSVSVDQTIPNHTLEEAEQELRKTILKKALAELKDMNEVTEGGYYLGAVQFQNKGDPMLRKAAAFQTTATYGSGFGALDDATLSNAQKVTLSANITFTETVLAS